MILTQRCSTAACSRSERSSKISALSTRQVNSAKPAPIYLGRRALLATSLVLSPLLIERGNAAWAEEETVSVVRRQEGGGKTPAAAGDLVLVHYVGSLADGTIFDSTRGGLKYRDGGDGALRPVIIKLGSDPVPGICPGLSQAILGMRVGDKMVASVPPSLGFSSTTAVLAPYAVIPPGSSLSYEIELLRLSRQGPDALMSGVSQCGGGFVNERVTGCADISLAEFV